jgi:hypothetical protein
MTIEAELNALRGVYQPDDGKDATLLDINKLAADLVRMRDAKKEIESALSEANAELDRVEEALIKHLTQNQLTSYQAPAGRISISHRFTAKLPQGEEKQKFYAWLKETKRFESMATIHSATFNSFIKEQYELAQERGEGEPQLPGVTDVKTLLGIRFSRAE